VMGLAATGSVDYEIKEEFIGTDFVLDQSGGKRLRGGPMYEVGVSVAHVSWSLGVAKRLLDEIKNLAHRKRRPGRPSLIDQPTFQRDFGEQIGNLEAARALVRSAFSNWEEAAKHGKPSLEVKAQARLAACWATKTCAAVGQFAYLAAGSDGARNGDGNNVMQRAFRDLHVGSTHKHVDENVLIDCASVLLGVNDPALVI
jgi:alkylation response protein AidB-like acyl-CoA dehydrogenase